VFLEYISWIEKNYYQYNITKYAEGVQNPSEYSRENSTGE
jgi:hypothetical protein